MKRVIPCLIAVLIIAAKARGAERLPVLIIDGQNNHDWKATTPLLQRMLEATQRFEVHVFSATDEAAWQANPPDFARYRAIVLNYFGKAWPRENTLDFNRGIANGCGLVVYHAALAGMEENPEFDKMIAVGWRKAGAGKHCCFDDSGKLHVKSGGGASGHDPIRVYPIDRRLPQHAILGMLPQRWTHGPDELYHTLLGTAEGMTILASGLAQATRLHEPLLWTVSYQKSRVFCTALGHDHRGIGSAGFQYTFTRGTEWAATGEVSLADAVNPPVPQHNADTEPPAHP